MQIICCKEHITLISQLRRPFTRLNHRSPLSLQRQSIQQARTPQQTAPNLQPIEPPISEAAILGKLTPEALGLYEPGGLFPSLAAITPAADLRTETEKQTPTTRPISEAQMAANRANVQHSCGPKTAAVLAISSLNRTAHDLARQRDPSKTPHPSVGVLSARISGT